MNPVQTSSQPKIDPQIVVNFLNEIHAIDPTVLPALIGMRVPCNETLANHPSIQCEKKRDERNGNEEYRVGLMGILNGLVGIRDYGNGYLAYVVENGERISGFRLTEETIDKEFQYVMESKAGKEFNK